MESINRTAVVVKPKQSFIDWLNDNDDDDHMVGDIIGDGTIFLLPEYDYLDDLRQYVKNIYDDLFVYMLEGWVDNQCQMPEHMTSEMFLEWFDIEIIGEVFDLVKDEIVREEV